MYQHGGATIASLGMVAWSVAGRAAVKGTSNDRNGPEGGSANCTSPGNGLPCGMALQSQDKWTQVAIDGTPSPAVGVALAVSRGSARSRNRGT